MNNFIMGLKRFFTNKNVITIILVIVILVVLYYGYSTSIKQQTNPINMPVAAKQINPETKITSSDVVYNKIAESMIPENAIRSSVNIIGKYTNINVTVPKGSLFYSEWLVKEEDVPGIWIEKLDYEAGELGYYMSVDVASTLGNSVLPNSYIDIYMKASAEDGQIMFGKLMKNVKILAVHDSEGNNIFSNPEESGRVSKIGFAVSQDMYILLKKAEYLKLELVIAPRGITVPTKDYIIVTSAALRDYINRQTVEITEDEILEDAEEDNTVEENNEVVE